MVTSKSYTLLLVLLFYRADNKTRGIVDDLVTRLFVDDQDFFRSHDGMVQSTPWADCSPTIPYFELANGR